MKLPDICCSTKVLQDVLQWTLNVAVSILHDAAGCVALKVGELVPHSLKTLQAGRHVEKLQTLVVVHGQQVGSPKGQSLEILAGRFVSCSIQHTLLELQQPYIWRV
jgi:hypothetical protein